MYRDVDGNDHDWRNVYDIPNSHLLEFSPSGGFDWRAENGHDDFFNVNGPQLGAKEWVHVAVAMTAADGGGYVPNVYVNGALTTESPNWQIDEQWNANGLQTTTDDLFLGILWSQNGEDGKRNNPDPWKGGIDEFKIWKSALSDVEIQSLVSGDAEVANDDLLLHFDFENSSSGHILNVVTGVNAGEIYGDVQFLGGVDLEPQPSLSFEYEILGVDKDFLGLPVPLPTESKKQIAVLGDSVDHSARYDLNITADILNQYNLEGADITIGFDTQLFNNIDASDITIGSDLPIANAVQIDNELGTIRLAAAALADLTQNGIGVSGETILASISLDFDETALATIEKYDDGSLVTNPLAFTIDANLDETVFSTLLNDSSGFENRDIQTLRDLGGSITVDGQDVTLYEAKVNLAQQGDGLVLGLALSVLTLITNLVRSGDTITSVEWLNVATFKLTPTTRVYNQSSLVSADFSQTVLPVVHSSTASLWKCT